MTILKSMLGASWGLGIESSLKARQDDGETLSVLDLDENLADVEKPPELPAGVYTGEVQDVQIQDSQKGNRYFAIKFVIPQDEIPADIRDQFDDGCVLYWNRQIVPGPKDRRALFNLRKLVEALGLDSAVSSIDPNEWMGCTARLRVVMGKYQGEERAEIKAIEAAERAAASRGKARSQVEEEVEEDEEATTPARRGGGKPARAGTRSAARR